jgi:mRNA interferase RelE/StbE
MYQVRILDEAQRDLARLDKSTAYRITHRILWLAENFHLIKPERLKGELSGLFKLRVGAYRVIYEILNKERFIIIHAIGHKVKYTRDDKSQHFEKVKRHSLVEFRGDGQVVGGSEEGLDFRF